jgi:4-hydroxy-3-methylbut-2-en-1-yl diphosphate reductase
VYARRPAPGRAEPMPPLIFRKGLDLKEAVAGQLAASYHSPLVQRIRANGYRYESGRLEVRLAAEFGFCYGVDRAVDYAYQARTRFPDRTVYLTGEIIHNPHVNDQLRSLGIRFLSDPGESASQLGPEHVVILPAFGVTIATLQDLSARGCTLVDTTCGSVLNVWKNVKRYAQEGFTSVIHGKYWHEETEATASQALQYPDGHYLVVYDHEERIGLANQTTMLSSESLEIGERFRDAMRDRHGEAALATRFRSFDTICSATQERQDAVIQLLEQEALDVMLVIGGYNSSNTCNLARICDARLPTYHIAEPDCLLSPDAIRFRPVSSKEELVATGWLPASGPVRLGLTAGASTPDNLVAQVIETVDQFCNERPSVTAPTA